MNMDVLLAALVEQGLGSLHHGRCPPTLKVNGRLVSLRPAPLDKTTALALIRESLDETHFERFLHTREANYAIQRGSLGRFRVSAFWQQDMPGMVLRRIETRIPTFDELVLPPSCRRSPWPNAGWCSRRRHWRRQVHHPGGHDRLSQPAR
jgi:twitching motility protein PilU